MLIKPKQSSLHLLGCICACLTLGLLAAIVRVDQQTGRSALWAALFAACWWGTVRFFAQKDRRLQRCFGLLGALFVLCCALGARLETCQQTGWDGLALCLGAALCAGPAAGAAGMAAMRLLEALPRADRGVRHPFALSFCVLMVCYLPYVLAFFPGITGYDMDFQVDMIRTGNYSAQHPLVHTLFIGLCMKAGEWLFASESIGYGIHTVIQTILLAASMAYALKWLNDLRCPKWLWWAILAFFGLSPQHGIMAVSGTKDILFSAGMLVLAVEICRHFMEPERARKTWVWIADVLVLVCVGMLRKNTIYGLAVMLVFCLLFARRALGRRFLAFALAGMLIAQGGMSALSAVTDAAEGSVREMLCVPFQQLARVHDLYGLDEPVGYEAREVMPFVDDYSPERADHVKRQARVQTPQLLARFLKLWLRESIHFPVEYIDAFLYNSKGFWYLEDASFATTYDEVPGSPIGCMVVTNNESIGIELMSALPAFREVCLRLFRLNEYMRYPILWLLIHPATYSWLMGFGLAWAAYRRKRGALAAMGVSFTYMLTLLLGPCALIRYSYYLMLVMPVLLGMLSGHSEKEEIHP